MFGCLVCLFVCNGTFSLRFSFTFAFFFLGLVPLGAFLTVVCSSPTFETGTEMSTFQLYSGPCPALFLNRWC
ncbi:hypothetical protein F5144DRAFT_554334 [Chaetomium tenue]|uniref:Uncharacterized protein n=1 Tax=Chaetomium tenue TaxID=1854479 RepID=A0ACB7PPE1_9PEZI|nr:hypothetical protein F5144DRAFT_554334 [Chaetomium globosum]